MRCTRVARLLQFYIDRRLSLEQTRVLESHLAACSSCREEFFLLEQVAQSLCQIESIAEPTNLTANIMSRVALSVQQSGSNYWQKEASREKDTIDSSWHPSLAEAMMAVILATISTLGIALWQPAMRGILPTINGHDSFSMLFNGVTQTLFNGNSGTLIWALWIAGAILGIWITLALAGNEMRSEWFKAMMDRMPVR